jgi:hypothetical protein
MVGEWLLQVTAMIGEWSHLPMNGLETGWGHPFF